VGTTFGVLLPFSRAHESEADVIGMMYMANAGYPPAESIDVWTRMDKAGGGGVPAFLSTHPSHKARKKKLREWLPKAKKKFERNRLPGDMRKQLWGGGSSGEKSGSSTNKSGSSSNRSGSSSSGGKPPDQDHRRR
jgi:predicted Zn-dependent protease